MIPPSRAPAELPHSTSLVNAGGIPAAAAAAAVVVR